MTGACYLEKVDDYDPSLVRRAMEEGWSALAEGGVRPCKPGDRILLKPNLLSGRPPEKAVNTHPVFCAAAAEFFLDRGCRVAIGDSPAMEGLSPALERAGYTDFIRRCGLEVVPFKSGRDVPSRQRRWFPLLHLYAGLGDFDQVLNLPKLKTHSQMTMTMAVKNLFGCVPGKRKAAYHLSAGSTPVFFARLLLEIHETVAPALTFLDGIVAMEGNGPGLGTPRRLGIFAATPDAVALDAVLGDVLGVPVESHPVVQQAMQAGILGALDTIPVLGCPRSELAAPDFKLPRTADIQWRLPSFLKTRFKNWWTHRPEIVPARCTACFKCREICPVGAITQNGVGVPAVNRRDCIRCYCCHEVCPSAAIRIVPGAGLKCLNFLTRSKDRNERICQI